MCNGEYKRQLLPRTIRMCLARGEADTGTDSCTLPACTFADLHIKGRVIPHGSVHRILEFTSPHAVRLRRTTASSWRRWTTTSRKSPQERRRKSGRRRCHAKTARARRARPALRREVRRRLRSDPRETAEGWTLQGSYPPKCVSTSREAMPIRAVPNAIQGMGSISNWSTLVCAQGVIANSSVVCYNVKGCGGIPRGTESCACLLMGATDRRTE